MIECETCRKPAEVVHYPRNTTWGEPGYCLTDEPAVDPKRTLIREILKTPGLPNWAVRPICSMRGSKKLFDGLGRVLP
jgi:hypothetical protein